MVDFDPTWRNLTGDQERAVQQQDNSLLFNCTVEVHLEAVHEAATSEVAARRRSGSWRAIGRRNLEGWILSPSADASGVCGCECACAQKGDHHENARNFAG